MYVADVQEETKLHNVGTYEEALRAFDWSIAENELGWAGAAPSTSAGIFRTGSAGSGSRRSPPSSGNDPTGASGPTPSTTCASFRTPSPRTSIASASFPASVSAFPRPRAGALHRVRRPSEARGRRPAPLLRLRRGVAPDPSRRRRDGGRRDAEEAPSKVRRIREALPGLRHVAVVDAEGLSLRDGESAFDLDAEPRASGFPLFPATAESPSVLHYTSGTTGQPKGAEHVHGSLLSQYLTAKWVLDLTRSDVYWCNADPGWVTGTSYGIIGPWSNGVTQAVLDSGFSARRWYEFIERRRITVWYSRRPRSGS